MRGRRRHATTDPIRAQKRCEKSNIVASCSNSAKLFGLRKRGCQKTLIECGPRDSKTMFVCGDGCPWVGGRILCSRSHCWCSNPESPASPPDVKISHQVFGLNSPPGSTPPTPPAGDISQSLPQYNSMSVETYCGC